MENKSNDETDMQGFPVYTAEFDILTKLTGFKLTRGMLCAMRRKPLQTLEKFVMVQNVLQYLKML